MNVEQWDVQRLAPYARDLKRHETALPRMVNALREWGFRVPLLVSTSGEIIDGKLRYLAALQLGMTRIPVVVADDLTPTQIRTFRLLVNRSATWADWNPAPVTIEREKGSSPVTVQLSPASVDRRTLHRLEPALRRQLLKGKLLNLAKGKFRCAYKTR